VIITDSANASSTGKIFTILFFNHFSSLALTPLQRKLWWIKLWGVLLFIMIQSQSHQGFNQLLLN
jgi:hypothetical protein